MYPETYKGTKDVMVAIGHGILRYGTLTGARAKVSAVLARIPWLDSHMKSDISACAEMVMRRCLLEDEKDIPEFLSMHLDGVMKAFNRAHKRRDVRTKRNNVTSLMKFERKKADPVVFYLVSTHQKPQKAHEPLQGKLLVDRYWSSILMHDGSWGDVSSYVKSHKTPTVQWAMGAPHYLITRPNCRHYLIPIPTLVALRNSERKLVGKYQRKPTHVKRPITDAQRWADYIRLRNAVKTALTPVGKPAVLGVGR